MIEGWAPIELNYVRKKTVREYYSRRAIDYDKQKARTWKSDVGFKAEILNEIIRAAREAGKGHGLEVGAGSGRVFLPLIKEAKLHIVGIDLSKGMLKLAKKKIVPYREESNLLLGDAEHLPFRDNAFSLLVCASTIHYLTSPEDALKEFSRVMKRKGIFVYGDVSVHEMDAKGFMDKLEKIISTAHGRYYKPSEMKRFIGEYGIRITTTKIIPYRKSYNSLIEDKANYFNIGSESLFRLIEESTTEQKALYGIDENEMTLFYTIMVGSKQE